MIRLRPGHYRRYAAGNRFALYDVLFACTMCHRPPPYRIIDPWPSDRPCTSRKAKKHSFKKSAPVNTSALRHATSNRYFPPAGSPQVATPPRDVYEPSTEPTPAPESQPTLSVVEPEPEGPVPTHEGPVKRSKWSIKARKTLRSKVLGAEPAASEANRLPAPATDTHSRTRASRILSLSLFGSEVAKRTGTLPADRAPEAQPAPAETIPREPPKLSPPGETRGPPTIRHTVSRKQSEKLGEPAQKIVVSVGTFKGTYKGELDGQTQVFLLCGTTEDNLEELLNHTRNKSPLTAFTVPPSGCFAVDFKHEFVLPLGDSPPPGLRISVVCTRETTRVDEDGKKRFSWRLNDVGSIVSPFRDMTSSQTVDWDVYPVKLNKQSGFEAENVVLDAKFVLCPDSTGPPVPPDEIEPFKPPTPPKAKLQKEAKHNAAAPVDIPRLALFESDAARGVKDCRLSTNQSGQNGFQELSSRLSSASKDVLSRRSSSVLERLERALREHSARNERLINKFLDEYRRREERDSRHDRKREDDFGHMRAPGHPGNPDGSVSSSLPHYAQKHCYPDGEGAFSGKNGASVSRLSRVVSDHGKSERDVCRRQEKLALGSSAPVSGDETFRLTRSPSLVSKLDFSEDTASESAPLSRSLHPSFRSDTRQSGTSRVAKKGHIDDRSEACANPTSTKNTSALQRSVRSDSRQSVSHGSSEAIAGRLSKHRGSASRETLEDVRSFPEAGRSGVFGARGLHALATESRSPSLSISPASTSRSNEPSVSSRGGTFTGGLSQSDRGLAGRAPTVKGMRRFPPPKKGGSGSWCGSETSASEVESTFRSRRSEDFTASRISPHAVKYF